MRSRADPLHPPMPPASLSYGTAPRINPRPVVGRSLAIVALVTLALWALRAAMLRFYYLDSDSVQAALNGVPGVQTTSIGGFDDTLGWTVANGEIALDCARTRTLSFQSPRRGELQSGRRMCVNAIGPYGVCVDVGDERVMVQFLDFGHYSEFRDVLPFHPRDVNELAARYDEILAFVLQEPSGTYSTEDGKVCTYKIRASR